MNIQIIGTKKCRNTKKAQMFFKERGVKFHLVDLNERELSPGELDKIIQKAGKNNIIDEESKLYKDKGFAYMDYDPREEVLENNLLLKTPIIRFDKEVTLGYVPDKWKEFISQA
ncbi:MAG: glutaredoxin [Spirochaetales bacterium]|nr:glutaredoxin [Spirochaetales bacterium]